MVGWDKPAAINEVSFVSPSGGQDCRRRSIKIDWPASAIEELPVIGVRPQIRPFRIDDFGVVWETIGFECENVTRYGPSPGATIWHMKVSLDRPNDDESSPALWDAIIRCVNQVWTENAVLVSERGQHFDEVIPMRKGREPRYVL